MGDLGSISGLGRSPAEGNGNPLQYSCLEIPHGQRNLAGYSPWDHKESDMTERLHFTSVYLGGFPGISAGKESACKQETLVGFLGQEDPMEKG